MGCFLLHWLVFGTSHVPFMNFGTCEKMEKPLVSCRHVFSLCHPIPPLMLLTELLCGLGVPNFQKFAWIGDFGNENVELVKSIAELKAPKAAILGNHDAWYTQKFSETRLDGVRAQLESLGEAHVGYDRLDFPEIKISVVGGRPFSSGGGQLFRRKLLSSRYGVHDMKGSAKKICDAAQGTPDGHSIILLAHNGPTGLGSEMDDICGRDWVPGGGDHGDPDLAQAIADLKSNTRLSIPLVVFGHMHKNLQLRNGTRRMLVLGAEKTIYLNAAVVPRVRGLISKKGSGSTVHNDAHEVKSKGTIRQFSVVDILNGNLEKIADTWISVVGDSVALQAEDVLFRRQH
ncbi:uncharacterized protein LOC18436596 isoform X2 [Amborella trichopoda]|uniref:uncharacterized protein LOC18436596 isoform X2 n=2 Tax=Amborella trichopoda TaxID=13333 RepID=UPI0009C13C36|nr:uncharacterized protein LOC18436596 isoform X2 [Amborella trichopoda]|eukprot:XP_020524379.1 uncharacterized protein LOC18436596 isoform X2 [Amborella trichopoda]